MIFTITVPTTKTKSYSSRAGASGPSGECGHFSADIDLTSYQDDSSTWGGQICVYGATLEEAEAIRDFTLKAIRKGL